LADYLLVTCEHGGNHVPPRYRRLFRDLQGPLKTHRGYDLGVLVMAREMSESFEAPLVASTVTRLLVDLNRSLGRASTRQPFAHFHLQNEIKYCRSLPALPRTGGESGPPKTIQACGLYRHRGRDQPSDRRRGIPPLD